MQKLFNYKSIIMILIIGSLCLSNSRVGFSRPNSIYRTPGSYFSDLGEGRISLGFSTEILDLEVPSNSSSAFVHTKIKKWNFGLTYTMLPDYRSIDQINATSDDAGTVALEGPLSEAPYDIGMHIQRRVYGYKSLYIDIGMHDLAISSTDADKGIFDDASFFFVVSNNKKFNKYDMTINYGFGTGKIGSDYHNYDDTSGPAMSPFLAILLNTPFFNNKMNLMFEYDGAGINIGTQLPITDIYSLRLGVSHINKITKWAVRNDTDNSTVLLDNDAPSIMLGFVMNIPDLQSDQERIKNQLLDPEVSQYGEFQPLVVIDSSKIKEQEQIISNYQDSLSVYRAELEVFYNENAQIRKEVGLLNDSTKTILLDIQIDKSKRNEAMRKFQESHDLLVEEKYYDALDLIDKAIELQPNLAIAYARRGTIYYYLNDLKAASINWNIALKIDPEYAQVRNILQGLKDGTLEPLYKNNIEE